MSHNVANIQGLTKYQDEYLCLLTINPITPRVSDQGLLLGSGRVLGGSVGPQGRHENNSVWFRRQFE